VNELALGDAVAALAAGAVVAIPTDTVYGLAVDPRLSGALERVFALKERPGELALPVLIAEPEEMAQLAEPPVAAVRLAGRYWPGALTIVVPRRDGVGFELGGDPATIGLRCPAHALVRKLLARTGPLAVTSANRHGEAPLKSAAEVRARFGAEVVVLDGGRCDARPSTVVLFADGELRCLREGEIAFAELTAFVSSP
jgi:tRNA threonylcarbamoyl adenosine modification protein (Sua5/YciO/YrdC/YwlC family)